MKEFEIQMRFNHQFEGEPIKRGKWSTWYQYDKFESFLSTWDQIRKGSKWECEIEGRKRTTIYQYRAIHNTKDDKMKTINPLDLNEVSKNRTDLIEKRKLKEKNDVFQRMRNYLEAIIKS